MKFDIFEYTSRGGRAVNEDCVDHRIFGDTAVLTVADGLGGHSLGEVASAVTVNTVLSSLESALENFRPIIEAPIVETQNSDGEKNLEKIIEEAIEKANDAILSIQQEKGQVLKSTLAMLLVTPLNIVLANVGDSRVYMLRQGEITEYTADHSVAYKKYKAGEITREEIGFDEDQSALLRTLGSDDRHEPSIYNLNLVPQKGDAFLLCSDGFWEYVKDLEIEVDYAKSENAKEWALKLLTRAMDRVDGDNDNITVLTVIVK